MRNEMPSSFNPLFVGEGSATMREPPGYGGSEDVSIPSSSGRGRRPVEECVGEEMVDKMFQSPLRRGGVGDPCVPGRERSNGGGFNPLFVGEGSATM